MGTIWVISHSEERQFDREDARVLSTLGEFAAAAYQAFSTTVALKSIELSRFAAVVVPVWGPSKVG